MWAVFLKRTGLLWMKPSARPTAAFLPSFGYGTEEGGLKKVENLSEVSVYESQILLPIWK